MKSTLALKPGVVVDRKDSCSDCARGYPAPWCRPLFAAGAGFHLCFANFQDYRNLCTSSFLSPTVLWLSQSKSAGNRERCIASLLFRFCFLLGQQLIQNLPEGTVRVESAECRHGCL